MINWKSLYLKVTLQVVFMEFLTLPPPKVKKVGNIAFILKDLGKFLIRVIMH